MNTLAALAIIVTSGLVAWKLIEAAFEFAETWAVAKYTGKAPHGWAGTDDTEEDAEAAS